ncbi:MAG: hypothetical protein Q7T80_16855 [Methanoregula sp.]|nr:hypothetical protein [Methanoregula sp.]
MSNIPSDFSAASSLTGYLYQCRLALFLALKNLRNNPNLTISFETLDDVVFEKNGFPKEIIQTKHHINRKGNLSDASTDLWKTLRIWMSLRESSIPLSEFVFYLMTTSTANEGNATFFLKAENRNVREAESKLTHTAKTSKNEDNLLAYTCFLSMNESQRLNFLNSVFIVDSCPLINELDGCLIGEILRACHRSKVESFLSYLEGWWYNRIIKSLTTDRAQFILGIDLDSRIDELREDFKNDSLPIHDDLRTINVNQEFYQDYLFVHQLKMIEVTSNRIAIAVNNYYRAREQRSRWLREDLLIFGDLDVYEDRLKEEWTIHFETMRENLGEEATEKEKIRAARSIYDWVEKEADIPLRKCQEPFITRGSYHILADKGKVGWHVDFESRIADLLNLKGVGS